MSLAESLKGKRILVTGAGRGIGKALVERLHKYGAIVFALSRNPQNLDSLSQQLPNTKTIAVDLEDWNATKEAVSAIGPLDGLINNAAVIIPEDFLDIQPENFDKTFGTNLKAIVNVSQIVARRMIAEGKGGSIVNISSVAGSMYLPKISMYCSCKAALDALTKGMAVELGRHNIRVNGIAPGFYATDMVTKDYVSGLADRFDDVHVQLTSRMPAGKLYLEMEYLVNSTLFLLSDLSQMTLGQTQFVDAGLLCG